MRTRFTLLSRREFLRRSLLVAAGALTAARGFGATKAVDPNAWALLADLHISSDRGRVARDVRPADNLRRVVAEIVALPQRPAGVLIAGDCAFNSGEAGDYVALSDLLRPLRSAGIGTHLALGNHDRRERFRAVFPEGRAAARALPQRHVEVIRAGRANWFVLDGLDVKLGTPGILGDAQRDWLARTLDANKSKPAILLFHHDLDAQGQSHSLKDADELLALLRPRQQVKACVFGHSHRWGVSRDPSGIHLINLPPTAYVFREGDPSGWVQATPAGQGMRLELRGLDSKHPAHGQVVNLDWR